MKKLSTNFKFIYFSQLLADTGDILYTIALIGFVYKQTQSAQASVYIPIIITSAIFLSGWFSPYVYHRWFKREILLFCQFIKTWVMLIILIVMTVSDILNVLYILAFINAFLDGFTNPLKMTLLPLTEREEHLSYANAQISMMNSIVQIGSWSLGGILLLIGSENLILFTLILYICSSLLIKRLHIAQDTKEVEQKSITRSFQNMLSDNYLLKESHFLNLNTIFESIGHSVWIAAILLVFVSEQLHANASWFSIINALFFTGLLTGGFIVSRYSDYLMPKIRFFVIYIPVVLSVLNLLFGYNQTLTYALLISFLFGLFDELRTTLMHTKIQTQLSNRKLTALYTLNSMIYALCFCISSFTIALIADHFSVVTAFTVAAASYFLCFIISSIYRNIF